jgi:DNA-binding transcriptional ArsR family regulator
MAGSDQSNHDLLAALSHPLRRGILRLMPEDEDSSISPRELAGELGESLTHVSYHVRVLAKCGAARLIRTERVRGSTRHFYRRKVEASWAKDVLAEPEQGPREEDSRRP